MEEKIEKKQTIFSGIQPSGVLTLGNYVGAIRNWVTLQEQYNCAYSVVDLHAITVRQDPKELRERSLNLLALYIACGIDPKKNLLFLQSHVPAHTQLGWILNCYTYMGELSRMTQFKDKSAKHADNINAGLFTYPALMAADILLYQSDLVPVGIDQKQHLELARDIAERFNGIYGKTFTVPEGYIPKLGAKIMDLGDPNKKMSKSTDDINTSIAMADTNDDILRKIKRAVTDSEAKVSFDVENKPGVSNLLTIMSAVSGESIESIVNRFEGKGYGEFKPAVAEAVIACVEPIRNEYQKLIADKAYLKEVCANGAERAKVIASRTMQKVCKKIGFVAE